MKRFTQLKDSNPLDVENEVQGGAAEEEAPNGYSEYSQPEGQDSEEREPITDLNELDLATEAMDDVDMDKLEERMSYAPTLKPGFYDFYFKLYEDRPAESTEIKGRMYAQFNYNPVLINEDGSEGRMIRFCRATNYRSPKMDSSKADELLFACGKLDKFQQTSRKPSDVVNLLKEAEAEGRVIRGQVIWTFYDKATGERYSTSPQKPYKKGDGTTVTELPWPKDGSGQLERIPGGREEIVRVMPTKETLSEIHAVRDGEEAA